MLPRLSVLQIGDIHLPSAMNLQMSVDDKDRRFPIDLKTVIAKQPVRKSFEKIHELIAQNKVATAIFMGDLTDYGDEIGFQGCVRYIANSLQIGTNGALAHIPIGIVSGNHDINRDLAKSASITAKFAPLIAALSSSGLPKIPVKDPIWLDLTQTNAHLSIALMNSCWGCGSPEFIPDEFRADVQSAIDNAIQRGGSRREITTYYERQFDTPAFSEESIQKLLNGYHDRPNNMLVVAAHHNLLPQRLPRLAPYTELVNSGALRSVLQELGKPVIYLHGHIHQDPIEILQIPGGAPIVSIAAPEISQGFNVVDIVFTRGGMPLSCRVTKWRFDGAGYLRALAPIKTSLVGRRRLSQKTSLAALYQTILTSKEIYWTDLCKKMASQYPSQDDLAEDLELLESDHRITIDNYDMAQPNWIVGAAI